MAAELKTFAKPIYLYRYRSLRRELADSAGGARDRFREELNAVQQRHIFCSRYRDMNDPMEGLYKSARSAREHPEYTAMVRDIRSEKLNLGIASFSETWDHPLMWAHYADGFRGICIAYHLRSLLDELPDGCALTRIAYAERPHTLTRSRAENQEIRAKALLAQKSAAWSYEREWRLFAPAVGPSRYDSEAIHHVYLGSRISRDQSTRLSRRLEAAGIEVRPTRIKGYSLVRERE